MQSYKSGRASGSSRAALPAENQTSQHAGSIGADRLSESRAGGAHFFPSSLSMMATRIMAAWRDLPPHTAAPPDGGHSVTMGHHIGQARCVRGGGILLFFRCQGRCVRCAFAVTSVNKPPSYQSISNHCADKHCTN
jgi:hypothetical protein